MSQTSETWRETPMAYLPPQERLVHVFSTRKVWKTEEVLPKSGSEPGLCGVAAQSANH